MRLFSPISLFFGALLLSPGALASPSPRECLTNAIYQEARSEPFAGQLAVGYTVWNRRRSGAYPLELCEIVGSRGQFHNVRTVGDLRAWSNAEHVARMVLYQAYEDPSHGATHFAKCGRKTKWTRKFPLTIRIGTHCFYRQGTTG